jgi:dTDP-4-dehydrorhamnose 3,5-epimerase-like enzyme
MDSYKVKDVVKKQFPNAQFIYCPPGDFHTFIVMSRDSSLYYVSSDALNIKKVNIDLIYRFEK